MKSPNTAGQATQKRSRALIGAAVATFSVLTLSACAGAEEYPGEFTVANGDSRFYVGTGPHRPDTVSVQCSKKSDVTTATITESQSGNTFVTTQPEEGSGYAGGTLTMGDGGEEFTWVPREGITEGDVQGDGQVFEDEMQDGAPVLWTDNGTFTFGYGLRQHTTRVDDGQVKVQTPGEVMCSGDSTS